MEAIVEWVKELYLAIDMLKREIEKLKEENKKLTEKVAKDGEDLRLILEVDDDEESC